jgi:hypothetical protein
MKVAQVRLDEIDQRIDVASGRRAEQRFASAIVVVALVRLVVVLVFTASFE